MVWFYRFSGSLKGVCLLLVGEISKKPENRVSLCNILSKKMWCHVLLSLPQSRSFSLYQLHLFSLVLFSTFPASLRGWRPSIFFSAAPLRGWRPRLGGGLVRLTVKPALIARDCTKKREERKGKVQDVGWQNEDESPQGRQSENKKYVRGRQKAKSRRKQQTNI